MNERRNDVPTRERLDQITAALAARERENSDFAEFLVRQAHRLAIGAVAGGVIVVVALVVGAIALIRSADVSNRQAAQRFDALVSGCEARNAQNAGIVGFLASIDQQGRPPETIAQDRRVAPFFPVHGFPIDGRTSPETHTYCVAYARGLTKPAPK